MLIGGGGGGGGRKNGQIMMNCSFSTCCLHAPSPCICDRENRPTRDEVGLTGLRGRLFWCQGAGKGGSCRALSLGPV